MCHLYSHIVENFELKVPSNSPGLGPRKEIGTDTEKS